MGGADLCVCECVYAHMHACMRACLELLIHGLGPLCYRFFFL